MPQSVFKFRKITLGKWLIFLILQVLLPMPSAWSQGSQGIAAIVNEEVISHFDLILDYDLSFSPLVYPAINQTISG